MPELDAPMMAILGALSMLGGALLITWGARRLGNSPDPRAESLLAPTLAVDTLDSDLRVLYMQTLVLDARCEARYGEERRDDWSRLGREIRRAIVARQAARVRGDEHGEADAIEEALEGAMAHVESGEPLNERWEQLRAAIGDRGV